MAKFRVRPFYVVPLLIVLGVGILWWVNHQNAPPPNPFGPGRGGPGGAKGGGRFGMMTNPVVVTPARSGSMNIYLNGLGTVAPIANVTVRTQISGQLIEVKFQEGQEVKKGDLLAVIDPRPYNNALEQAEGQLLEAQSQLKDAQVNLERYKQLAQQDSIAQQQVDTQAALVTQYQGAVRVDQAAIDTAKLNLTYCHIVAPVSGRVGLRQVDQGNYVTPGDASGLVVLTQVKPISVIFALPEDDVQEVVARLHAGKPLVVDAFDRTVTTKLATGTLTSADNQVDQSTGTFKLRATFPNTDEKLYPNQFVNARLLLDVLRDVTLIPTSAIERGEQGSFVYVVKTPDNVATAKNVTLGETEGERVQVLSGLEAGDLVVVDGADKLKDGMQVTIQQATDANPSTGVPADYAQRRKGKGFKGKGGKGKGNWPGSGGASGTPSAAPASAPSS